MSSTARRLFSFSSRAPARPPGIRRRLRWRREVRHSAPTPSSDSASSNVACWKRKTAIIRPLGQNAKRVGGKFLQYSCRASFGRRIGDFRGRLSGVSRRCPARQSQRRGATARTERPRTRRRRPRSGLTRGLFGTASPLRTWLSTGAAPCPTACCLFAAAPGIGARARRAPLAGRVKTPGKRSHTARNGRNRSYEQTIVDGRA